MYSDHDNVGSIKIPKYRTDLELYFWLKHSMVYLQFSDGCQWAYIHNIQGRLSAKLSFCSIIIKLVLMVAVVYEKDCCLTAPCEKLTTNGKSKILTIMDNADNKISSGNSPFLWNVIPHAILQIKQSNLFHAVFSFDNGFFVYVVFGCFCIVPCSLCVYLYLV